MKYIKAKRCYICSKLTDLNDGGWLIAKRYLKWGDVKDVFICNDCGADMIKYIECRGDCNDRAKSADL